MKVACSLFRRFSRLLMILSMLYVNIGCEDASHVNKIDATSSTGSVSFNIEWLSTNKVEGQLSPQAISDVCGTASNQVSSVKAEIYSGTTLIKKGPSWLCSAGSGTITDVMPGDSYSLRIAGLNSDNLIRYSGETSIDVVAGQTTNAGSVIAIKSYATKTVPSFSGAMGIDPDGQTFEWRAALGVNEYRFQIRNLPWDDPSSLILVNEHLQGDTSFIINSDHGLSSDTEYFWGVFPQGFDADGGYDFVWSFTTGTTASEDLYEQNDSLATAWDNGGAPADWEGEWLSDIEGSGTAVAGDDDWYKIEVNTDGYERIMIECRFDHDYGDIELYLYDASENELAYSVSGSNNEHIDFVVPSTGIYYIKIENIDVGSNTYDLYWNDVEKESADGIWTMEFDWNCDGSYGDSTAFLYANNRFIVKWYDSDRDLWQQAGGSWFLNEDYLTVIFGGGAIYTAPLTGFASNLNLTAFAASENNSFDVTPDTMSWGQSFDIASAVKNVGSWDIDSGTEIFLDFYLSTDTTFNPEAYDYVEGNMVDADGDTGCWTAYRTSMNYDYLLGTVRMDLVYADGLPADWYEWRTSNFTLPASAPEGFPDSGTIYIGMVIDPNNDIEESNEIDNFGIGAGLDYYAVSITP